MQTGTIKRITDRGFGFIGVDNSNSEKDLFFHSNELVGVTFEELKEGDRVEFEVVSGPKGNSASKVSRISEDAKTEEAKETDTDGADSDTEE